MENKLNTAAAIGGIMIAAASFGHSWFTRNQDKTAEFMEKEAQYRAETSQKIQDVKEGYEKALHEQNKRFNEYVLKNQKEVYELRQELSLQSSAILRAQQQFEHVQSQSRIDNQILRDELLKKMKK